MASTSKNKNDELALMVFLSMITANTLVELNQRIKALSSPCLNNARKFQEIVLSCGQISIFFKLNFIKRQ